MTTSMSVAPLSKASGWHFGGVSRNLNVSFLRPVPSGMTVHVVCEVANLGKNLGRSFRGFPVSGGRNRAELQLQRPSLRKCRLKAANFYAWLNTTRYGSILLLEPIRCNVPKSPLSIKPTPSRQSIRMPLDISGHWAMISLPEVFVVYSKCCGRLVSAVRCMVEPLATE